MYTVSYINHLNNVEHEVLNLTKEQVAELFNTVIEKENIYQVEEDSIIYDRKVIGGKERYRIIHAWK
jgi:hypothetical protein